MNTQDVIRLWAARLRSGKYAQGHGRLRDGNNRYCCLGVLCELAVEHEIIPPGRPNEHGSWVYGPDGEGSVNVLPAAVADWAGTDGGGSFSGDPIYSLPGYAAHQLWQLNDTLRWDFTKIADFIENRPLTDRDR